MSKSSETTDVKPEERTGLFSELFTCINRFKEEAGNYAEASVNDRIGERLAKRVSDGRSYMVKMLPLKYQPSQQYGEPATEVIRKAVTLLLIPEEAEVGEYVAWESLNAQNSFYDGLRRKLYTRPEIVFGRETVYEVGGVPCWKRVE